MTSPLALLFPPHPVLSTPSAAELARLDGQTIQMLSLAHKEAIANAKRDPLNYGYVPQNWRDAKALLDEPGVDSITVFGGNRSSKTTFAAWLVVQALLKNPGTKISCWSQSQDMSDEVQQAAVFQMLPPEFRKKMRSGNTKMVYTLANGFTGNSFVLPNGSKCTFRFYTQYIQNAGQFEGMELGWKGQEGELPKFTNIGNWFDEYLIDPGLMEMMDERLSTRNAKGLMTFTPVDQYTETVEEILEGAETIKNGIVYTPDNVPEGMTPDPEQTWKESVPYIQRGRQDNKRIIYFYTRENKFHNYERTKRNLVGKPKAWVLMKVFGTPTKTGSAKFPKFSRKVNVLKPQVMKDLMSPVNEQTGERADVVSRYMVADPAGGKPWFLLWMAVDEEGAHYCYREWPSKEQYGAWAEREHGKWVPGPAQTGRCCGTSYDEYAELIRELEKGEKIRERKIDPRLGAQKVFDPASGRKKASIVEEMAQRKIYFTQAPGEEESVGIMKLQSLMGYDDTKPIDETNKPKWYVSEACGNLIAAHTGYDVPEGKTDLKHPHKDPIDDARYGVLSEFQYVPDGPRVTRKGRGAY